MARRLGGGRLWGCEATPLWGSMPEEAASCLMAVQQRQRQDPDSYISPQHHSPSILILPNKAPFPKKFSIPQWDPGLGTKLLTHGPLEHPRFILYLCLSFLSSAFLFSCLANL